MVDMTGSNFFEEDDEFFADAFRSISEIETSSLTAVGNNNSEDLKDVPIEQNQLKKSDIFSPIKNNNFFRIENCKKSDVSPQSSSKDCSTNLNFLLRCTPKATKRKFPGSARILMDEPTRKLSVGNSDVSKNFENADSKLEPILSSQVSVEELLETVSWKRLQEDVSSNHKFLSNAKHFSVQQVLSDTSKKRLPKHVVVPILCLFIKKFNSEEPVSVYMDETGEISGKVDKEVLELYKNCIRTGTSLILKKVTFVCNVMLLEKSSLLSIYLDDGTVHHIQNFDVLEDESFNTLSCIFPVTPKVSERSVREENLMNTPTIKKIHNLSVTSSNSRKMSPVNANFSAQISFIENKSPDLHSSDVAMDDFDELLGNLDEKSFLEDF